MPKERGTYFDFWKIITIAITVLFVFFLIYPLITLFISGFRDAHTNEWTLSYFKTFFTKRFYYRALLNSFSVTITVTALSILVGLPLAYFMTAHKIRGKNLVEILIIISMMSPAFIGAYSWVLLGGRNGVITKFISGIIGHQAPPIYGFGGILLVFTMKLYPFIYMYASGALKKVDMSLIEAAEGLGCSGVKRLFTLIIPVIMPTVFAGSLLVFMNALADFGTPMLIGEGYITMPVLIFNEFINEVGGQANFAASMALIMVFITAVLFLLQKYYINKKSFTMSSLRPIPVTNVKGIKNILMHGFIYLVVFIAIIPQLTVIYTSFLNTNRMIFIPGYSFNSYRMVFSNLGTAIKNTYTFGLTALLLIVIMGMLIAYITTRRRNALTSVIDSVTMLPYIIPGSVLGITLLLAFNKPPVLLSGTGIIIIIVFIMRRMAYTIRSSAAILYQISPSIEEASISLGVPPAKTFFKVTMVMMLPGVFSGAILSWITIINELSASVILYTTRTRTMAVAIYAEVIRASYGTAAALSTILCVTTIISLLIFFKISGKREVSI